MESPEQRSLIDEAIASLTHVGVSHVTHFMFAADIGNTGEDTIDWIFKNGGASRKVTLPRAAVAFQRETGVNFWLVEMSERIAEIYGLADMRLSDEDALDHRNRIYHSQNN